MFDVVVKSSLVETLESAKPYMLGDPIELKGSFSTGNNTYLFELKSDGTGKIIYKDCFDEIEEFFHELNLKKLAREIEVAVESEVTFQSEINGLEASEVENIHREFIAEKLEELFWEEINQTLEDPFFRSLDDESEWGEAVRCEYGNEGELEEFLELCVLTEKQISNSDDFLIIYTETECDPATISEGGYYSERINELVEIACQYFKPVGCRYDYNDGYYDRYSGYTMSSESINIYLKELAKTPIREKMLGMIQLRKKLTAMKVDKEKIERLTSF